MEELYGKYTVTNVFCDISNNERKEKINKAIRTLCVMDIEKSYELDYNNSVEFHGSVSAPNKGGAL